MTRLLLIRHAPTDWNAAKKLQGRTDLPLSQAGRDWLTNCALPPGFSSAIWFSSPLRRAVETARTLMTRHDINAPLEIDPALAEMNFGAWEGRTIAELRADAPGFMAEEERGLDMQPPGGETPRQVQARLAAWLGSRAAPGVVQVAVTHKAVIRAIFALATGWNMIGKPPMKLRLDHAQEFTLDAQGWPLARRLNIPLVGS